MAGAFLLNVRHWPAVERLYDFGILKVSWVDKFSGKPANEEVLRQQLHKLLGPGFSIETPLFVFNYGEEITEDE